MPLYQFDREGGGGVALGLWSVAVFCAGAWAAEKFRYEREIERERQHERELEHVRRLAKFGLDED